MEENAAVAWNNTTAGNITEVTEGIDPNALGIISGVVTFIVISILFGIAAIVAMCRLRKKLPSSLQHGLAQHRNIFLIPNLPNQTTDEKIKDQEIDPKYRDIKISIAARHYMKNGFHLTIEDDSPAKRKLTKVKSVPPVMEENRQHLLKDQDGTVITNKLCTSPGGNTKAAELLLKRARSLKVERSVPSDDQMEIHPVTPLPPSLVTPLPFSPDTPQNNRKPNVSCNTLTVPAFKY